MSKSALNSSTAIKMKQTEDIFKNLSFLNSDSKQRSKSTTPSSYSISVTQAIAHQPQFTSSYTQSFYNGRSHESHASAFSAQKRSLTPSCTPVGSATNTDTFLKNRITPRNYEIEEELPVGSRVRDLLNAKSSELKINSLGLGSLTHSGITRSDSTPHKR